MQNAIYSKLKGHELLCLTRYFQQAKNHSLWRSFDQHSFQKFKIFWVSIFKEKVQLKSFEIVFFSLPHISTSYKSVFSLFLSHFKVWPFSWPNIPLTYCPSLGWHQILLLPMYNELWIWALEFKIIFINYCVP